MTVKRKQLVGVPDSFLKCRSRTWGHMWEDIPSPSEPHYWSIQPDFMGRCMRCGCEKFLWFDHEGNIVGAPQYTYPEGYKLAGIYRGDRLTSAELRAEVLRRTGTKKNRARLQAVS